jgi:hypothetical protein
MKPGVKPSFFMEKMKPSSKYELKVWSFHQNMKAKKASSKYKVRGEASVFKRKNEIFVEI